MPTSSGRSRRRQAARRSILPSRAGVSPTAAEVSAISWRSTWPLCRVPAAQLGLVGVGEPWGIGLGDPLGGRSGVGTGVGYSTGVGTGVGWGDGADVGSGVQEPVGTGVGVTGGGA